MKKSILTLGILSLLSAGFQSCKDEVSYPVPESLSSESIKATPGAGKVTISWNDIKNTENIYYVQCTYSITDGDKTTDYKKLASKYSTSMEIDNLLKRYGTIDFTLQTYNRDYVAGEIFSISAQSEAAEKTVVLNGKSRDIELKGSDLYTDDQEETEGPIADLLDGKTGTYFHASWTAPFDMPHYIVVDLGKEIYGVSFNYTTRNHSGAGNHPKEMNVYVSKTFDGATYDPSKAELLDNLTGLPNGPAASKQSANYMCNDSFRYLWLEVLSTHGNTQYFAMSELSVKELFTSVYDPETGITTEP
jgi:F5/8 type C domain.